MGEKLTRREIVARTAWIGAASALAGVGGLEALLGQAGQRVDESSSRMGGPAVTPLPPANDKYPVMPTWKTDLRQLAPNVYVYQQQGGTGFPNAGISNAGLFVGEDSLLVFDAQGYPLPSKGVL